MADQEFQKKVRDRLANYEEQPKDDLWGGIHSQIPASIPFFTKKRKLWSVAAGIGIVMLLGGYFFLDQNIYDDRSDVITSNTQEINAVSSLEGQNDSVNDNLTVTSQKEGAMGSYLQDEREVLSRDMNASKTPESSTTQAVEEQVSEKNSGERSFDLRSNDKSAIRYADSESNTKGNESTYATAGYEVVAHSADEGNSDFGKPKAVARRGVVTGYPMPGLRSLELLPEDEVALVEMIPDDKEEKDEKKSASKFKGYIYGMPTLSYSRITTNRNDDILITGVEKVPAFSEKRLGLRIEGGLTYALSEKFNLFGGLVYFQRDQEIRYTVSTVTNVNGEAFDNGTLLTPEREEVTYVYENNLRNVGLQLGGAWNMSSDKFLLTAGAGIELHKNLIENDQQFDGAGEPSFYAFSNLFYRVEYPKDSKLRFLTQPTFNYSLNISKDFNTPFYVRPYGFGLNLGLTYQF